MKGMTEQRKSKHRKEKPNKEIYEQDVQSSRMEAQLAEVARIKKQKESGVFVYTVEQKFEAEDEVQKYKSELKSLSHIEQELTNKCSKLHEELEYYKIQNISLRKTEDESKKCVSDLQSKLSEKTLQHQRSEYLLREYADTLAKHREQNNELKSHLRESSTKYRNLYTTYKNKEKNENLSQTHQIRTMEKMIQFYDQFYEEEGVLGEKEIELKKFVELSSNQQADIDLLLEKLIEKQEYYRNRCAVLEEERVKWENEIIFTEAHCDTLERTIKNLIEIEHTISNRCSEINEENIKLRVKVEQLLKVNQQQKSVENELKLYSSKFEESLKIIAVESQIVEDSLDKNILNEQIKKNIALSRKLVELEQKLRSYSNLEMELEEYQLKYKRLSDSNNQLEKKLKKCKQENQDQKVMLLKGQEENSKKNALIKNLNSQLQQRDHLLQNQRDINQQQLSSAVLVTSQILFNFREARNQLTTKIQDFQGPIRKTQLIFRKDAHHNNFGSYLSQDFPLLLIIKINKDTLFGAFSSCFRTSNQSGPCFLFSFDNSGQIKCFFKNENVEKAYSSISYGNNLLFFGNNEVSLRNNAKDKEFTLNINIFGGKYYNISMEMLKFTGLIKDNKVLYEQLEIHRIEY